ALLPLDLADINADYYAGNCHKWLLAPTGSGFLHFGPETAERVQPLQVSWGWHYDPASADQPDPFGSTPRLVWFEFEGPRVPCPWLTVPAAIDFQAHLGWSNIRGRIAELVAYTRGALQGKLGLPLATPAHSGLHAAMSAVELPPNVQPQSLR